MTARAESYTVGWICAIQSEYVIACELLDEEYKRDRIPKVDKSVDNNSYTFGRIHEHHVVIACLPKGRYGTTSATVVAQSMLRSFKALRIRLMVGIAGGAPSPKHDIRLGDVVVSLPGRSHGGVIQYDFGKAISNHEFEQTAHLSPPPTVLLNAISTLDMLHVRNGHRIQETIATLLSNRERLRAKYSRPSAESDKLYQALEGSELLVLREARGPQDDDPMIHYGLVASGNTMMKDQKARDALLAKYDVLCFEMEASGLMNDFPCLVIRGICDYSDHHKNDDWQGYAAATAAAYAKELLEVIPVADVQSIVVEMDSKRFHIQPSLEGVPVPKEFIERSTEMESMKKTLISTESSRNRRKVFVLHGLGGIGKTQLAVEFMRRYKTHFSAIFWLDGSSEVNLKTSLARQLHRLPRDQISTTAFAYIDGGSVNISAAAQEMLDWLSFADNNEWLLIFDNVDHDFGVQGYLPNADHGSILITTRLVDLHQLGESQEIKEVDSTTSRSILRSWYRHACDEANELKLLDKLQGLPLAIAQAGAFLQASGTTIEAYLQMYETQWVALAQSMDISKSPIVAYPGRSVWTTWSISFDAVRTVNPQAANLLLVWSHLNNKDLWADMFAKTIYNCESKELMSKWLGDIISNRSAFRKAIKTLRSYSLVEPVHGTDSFNTHVVVHQWAYFSQEDENVEELAVLSTTLLGLTIPMDTEPGYATAQRRLFPHAQACFDRVSTSKELVLSMLDASSQLDFLGAVDNLGTLYWNLGKLEEAEKITTLAMRAREKLIGADKIKTLNTKSNLTGIYQDQNRYEEAKKLGIEVLQGMEKALGLRHISTLRAMIRLAGLYSILGKHNEAERLALFAWTTAKETRGAKDILTLRIAVRLVNVYIEQDKFDEAEKMFVPTLKSCEEVHGENDVSTLVVVSNFGNVFLKRGDLTEAERLFTRALHGMEKALGPKHPFTINAVHRLGLTYFRQNRLDLAEAWYLRAQEEFQSTNGAKHISVAHVLNDLGNLYRSQGKLADAEHMYVQSLQSFVQAFGPNHEYVTRALQNFDLIHRNQISHGDPQPILSRALQVKQEILGRHHGTTLNSVIALSSYYIKQSKWIEAIDLNESALQGKDGVEALESSHISLSHIANNLGNCYRAQNRFPEAQKMFSQAIESYETLLGPTDDVTLATMNKLGQLYLKHITGTVSEAEALFKQLLQHREEKSGPNHELTLDVINDLGSVYFKNGNLIEAEKLFGQALEGWLNTLGSKHSSTCHGLHNLGMLYLRQNKIQEAEELLTFARQGYEAAIECKSTEAIVTALLNTVRTLGDLYSNSGRLSEAKDMYERGFSRNESRQTPSSDASDYFSRRLEILDKAIAAKQQTATWTNSPLLGYILEVCGLKTKSTSTQLESEQENAPTGDKSALETTEQRDQEEEQAAKQRILAIIGAAAQSKLEGQLEGLSIAVSDSASEAPARDVT